MKPNSQSDHRKNNSGSNKGNSRSVGCIYASNPQFKSNIFQCCFFLSNPLSNDQNSSKIFSLIFLYFYWHLFLCHFLFFWLSTVWRFMYLLLPRALIPSQGSPYWHIGSTQWFGHTMVKALKGWVSGYTWVRHIHMASLLSVYTHWGGEPWWICCCY